MNSQMLVLVCCLWSFVLNQANKGGGLCEVITLNVAQELVSCLFLLRSGAKEEQVLGFCRHRFYLCSYEDSADFLFLQGWRENR